MTNYTVVMLYCGAYAASIGIGCLTIGPIVHRLSRRYYPDVTWDMYLPRIVGALEQFMYITCYLLRHPEFIAVWLAIKLAGEWRQTEGANLHPLYNIFLVGNALSLIYSVGTALLMKRFLPAFP